MNERIEKLVEQADTYAYKMNPEEDSYGRPANPRKFQQERDAKFAELIVLECAEVADNADATREKWEGIGKYVREHFGVE
jgi:hypothetical protein